MKRMSAEKPAHSEQVVGCSPEMLKKFLNKKAKLLRMHGIEFLNKKQVANVKALRDLGISQIDIDHVYPCAAFNMQNKDHVIVCFHYTNNQLLPHKENMRKGSSVPPGFDVEEHVKKMLAYIKKAEKEKKSWEDVLKDQVEGKIPGFVERNSQSMWWNE